MSSQKGVEYTVPAMDKVYLFAQILYREARYLDEYRYADWFDMIDPEIHYHVPARRSFYTREESRRVEPPYDTDHYDDDYDSLTLRVKRYQRADSSSLDPRPREIRQVSNVEVFPTDIDGVWRVHSTIMLVRNRLLDLDESIAGRRVDEWREVSPSEFRLVKRTVWISQNSILIANMASLL